MFVLQLLAVANFVALCMATTPLDPSQWPLHYPFCGGMSQSPVDISLSEVQNNPSLGNIVYSNFNTLTSQPLQLLNTGEQAKLSGFDGSLKIQSGGLPTSYILQQLHFHVGSIDDIGSEHSINGEFYPAEMHLVFYSSQYADIKAAQDQPDGLAVLGVLFHIDDDDNDAFQPIIDKLCNVQQPHDTAQVDPLKVGELLPEDASEWFRYSGSLTTPPCYESVIWTVFKDFVEISEDQLNTFRTCLNGDAGPIVDNFRPTQALNGRVIHEN